MKKLLFVVGLVLSSTLNAQKVETTKLELTIVKLKFESYLGFTAGSKANVHAGLDIQNDSTYQIDRIGIGSNDIVIDIKQKTMTNVAVAGGKNYNETRKIENVVIKNDTLTFQVCAVSRLSNLPYTEYHTIVLSPSENSICAMNTWINPKYGNIGGQYINYVSTTKVYSEWEPKL